MKEITQKCMYMPLQEPTERILGHGSNGSKDYCYEIGLIDSLQQLLCMDSTKEQVKMHVATQKCLILSIRVFVVYFQIFNSHAMADGIWGIIVMENAFIIIHSSKKIRVLFRYSYIMMSQRYVILLEARQRSTNLVILSCKCIRRQEICLILCIIFSGLLQIRYCDPN